MVGLAKKRPPERPAKALPKDSDLVKVRQFRAELPQLRAMLNEIPGSDKKAETLLGQFEQALNDNDVTAAKDTRTEFLDRVDGIKLPMLTALEGLKFDATTPEEWRKKIERSEAFLEKYSGYPQQCAEAKKILAEANTQQHVARYAQDSKAQDGEAALNPMEPGKIFGNLATVMRSKLVQECGLTEGDVIAIRTYTADNYKFINPATVNSKDRADENMLDLSKAKTEEERRQMEADIAKFEKKGWLDDKGRLRFENVGKEIKADSEVDGKGRKLSPDDVKQLLQDGHAPRDIARLRFSAAERKLLDEEEAEFFAAVKKYKKPEFMDIQMGKGVAPRKISKLEDETAREQEQKQFDAEYEAKKKELYDKGSVHAAVLLQALKKLPKKAGKVYRGARMSESEFNSTYKMNDVTTVESFQSNSMTESVAEGFATGAASLSPLRDDQTLHVMCVMEVLEARDVNELSVADEKEWVLLPEAKLVVTDIKTATTGPRGNFPFAKKWITVTMKQQI